MLESQSEEQEPINILFVDDEKNIISALNRLFRSEGYKVFTALSAKIALEILQQNVIHIVVSDMKMPEMAGDEFLEQVSIHYPETIRILLTGYAELNSTINAINKGKIYNYVSKPWDDAYLKSMIGQAVKHIHLALEKKRLEALTQKQNDLLTKINSQLDVKVKERTAELEQALFKVKESNEKVKKNFITFIKVMSSFAELRDAQIVGHSRQVGKLAMNFALHLGLDQKEAQDLLFAGMLHDIGKICLSDALLFKKNHELTHEERETLKGLPFIICDILMGLDYLNNAVNIIRHYQEHFDGTGYPGSLKGQDIPMGARILSIVNDYDHLIHGRMSSFNDPIKQWRQHFKDNRFKKYDGEIVDHFFTYLEDLENKDKIQDKGVCHMTLVSEELKPGMVLGNDVISGNGLLLLPQGFRLEQRSIDSIVNYELRTLERLNYIILKDTF